MKSQAMRRLGVLAAAALALSACGSSDSKGSTVDASCKPENKISTVKDAIDYIEKQKAA